MHNFEKSIYRQFDVFINDSKCTNEWLHSAGMKVYVRKTHRIFTEIENTIFFDIIADNKQFNCIDIANIEVKEKYKRKGCFKRFVNYVESLQNIKYIFFELVFSDIIINYCLKNNCISDGYKRPSFYKQINST